MSILSLLIGIAILIILSYLGVKTFLSVVISCIVVLLLNSMNVWANMSGAFVSGFVQFLSSYIFVLTAGAMFGRLMSASGCARAFALKLLALFGEKRIIAVLIAATSIFGLCGINIYIMFYAVYPIAVVIGQRQNISKGVLAAAMWSCSFTVGFPGAITFNNIICGNYLQTNYFAGLVIGIAGSAVTLLISAYYTFYVNKKSREKGLVFEPGPQDHVYLTDDLKDEDLPHWIIAIIPLLVVAVSGVVLSMYLDAIFAAVIAILLASLVLVALNFKRLKTGFLATVGEGLMDGFGPLLTVASLVGFGAIIKLTPGFSSIIQGITDINMNPYMGTFLATNVLVGITGSISGGLTIFLETLSQTFLDMGIDPGVLHRIAAMSACGLDSLPHSAGIIGQLAVLQLTVKNGYKHAFVTTVVATTAGSFVAALLAMVLA